MYVNDREGGMDIGMNLSACVQIRVSLLLPVEGLPTTTIQLKRHFFKDISSFPIQTMKCNSFVLGYLRRDCGIESSLTPRGIVLCKLVGRNLNLLVQVFKGKRTQL